MVKKILTFFMIIVMGAAVVGAPVYAGSGDEKAGDISQIDARPDNPCTGGNFLGLRPWYYKLLKTNCLEVKEIAPEDTPDTSLNADQIKITPFVLTVVGNILSDIFILAIYASVGVIIYGGYLYITSEGNPEKAKKAQKTLSGAIVGLIIALVATSIVRFMMEILLKF